LGMAGYPLLIRTLLLLKVAETGTMATAQTGVRLASEVG
jgi:hypothetical protein